MSSHGIFSGSVESVTSVLSFVLLDQRSVVDHAEVAVNLHPVLEFVISRTEHGGIVSILQQ